MSWYGPPPELPGQQPRPGGQPALPAPADTGYGAPGYQPGYQPGYGAQVYQPGYGAPVYGPPPENNLIWAILSTVLCCWPLGIPSIIFANQVNTKWMMGDVAGAHEAARKARQFAIWGAIVHLILIVVIVLIYVGFFALILGAVATSSRTGSGA